MDNVAQPIGAEQPTRQLRFKPRARIIRTIGDQLISGPEAAIIELVKNAYDADARTVKIAFWPPLRPGEGRIVVTDDGHGMALSDIEQKWMEPATTSKTAARRSALGRKMMGSKGIGRFAAAKLGGKMGLRSVSADGERHVEVLISEIDWEIFSGDRYLADVAIDYLAQETSAATGTEIEVRELNEVWTKHKLERLLGELRRLVSPLESHDGVDFRVFLDLTACTIVTVGFDGASIVNALGTADSENGMDSRQPNEVRPFPLLTACDYEVTGEFDVQGHFSGTVQIRRAGRGPEVADLNVPLRDDDGEEACGRVGVRFFIFDREVDALKSNLAKAGLGAVTAAEARNLIDSVAGIAVYRDGFRVRPYGDLQTDWLLLDRRRVQDPSRRIGHNQIAGYVTVEDQHESLLVERSSREGFEDNGAYRRLRRLLLTLLAQIVEPKRRLFREDSGLLHRAETTFEEVRQLAGLRKIRDLVASLPRAEQTEAYGVIGRESARLIDRIAALEDRQRLLEAKSSLGAIVGEVLHEGAGPAGFIASTSQRVQRLWTRALSGDAEARQDISQKLHLLHVNGDKLSDLFDTLRPLAGGKRGPPKFFRPVESVASAKAIFEGHHIPIEIEGGIEAPEVIGYPGDLTTACVNLVGNAVHWLEQSATALAAVKIGMTFDTENVWISVADNGPGVPNEFKNSIFDVGFSLKDGGTGLGLNIAREALARSGADLLFDEEHSQGARFVIRFDRAKTA